MNETHPCRHYRRFSRSCYSRADPAIALPQIRDLLAREHANNTVVVGHNLAFDYTMLSNDLLHHGLADIDKASAARSLDTMLLYDQYGPHDTPRSLAAAAEHFNITTDHAHDAYSDAVTSGRLAYALADVNPAALQRLTFDNAHRHQAAWADERLDNIVEKRESWGKNTTVERGWPILAEQSQRNIGGEIIGYQPARNPHQIVLHIRTKDADPLELGLRDDQPKHRLYAVADKDLIGHNSQLPASHTHLRVEGVPTINPNLDRGPHAFLAVHRVQIKTVNPQSQPAQTQEQALHLKLANAARVHETARFGADREYAMVPDRSY